MGIRFLLASMISGFLFFNLVARAAEIDRSPAVLDEYTREAELQDDSIADLGGLESGGREEFETGSNPQPESEPTVDDDRAS